MRRKARAGERGTGDLTFNLMLATMNGRHDCGRHGGFWVTTTERLIG